MLSQSDVRPHFKGDDFWHPFFEPPLLFDRANALGKSRTDLGMSVWGEIYRHHALR